MFSKRHYAYLLIRPVAWPFFISFSFFFFFSGFIFYTHRIYLGGAVGFLGLWILFYMVVCWFTDLVIEAGKGGRHSIIIRVVLITGFLLFLISEVMLFFGFFWAFFHSALTPALELSLKWPPEGIQFIKTFEFPFFNTLLLIISGFSITWIHRAIVLGLSFNMFDSFFITIILGISFIKLQIIEYVEAFFDVSDSLYSSIFYMLTGLHGLHVFVGVIFILMCFLLLLLKNFTFNRYLSLMFAIWYWHFVDIIWIMLYLIIYSWGNL